MGAADDPVRRILEHGRVPHPARVGVVRDPLGSRLVVDDGAGDRIATVPDRFREGVYRVGRRADELSVSSCIDRHHVRRLSMMTHVGLCSARSAASLPGLDTTRARDVKMRGGSALKSRSASTHERGSSLPTTSTVPTAVLWPAHG